MPIPDHPFNYPDFPGYATRDGTRDTALEAATAMAPRAKNLRERVLEALRTMPGTPEQIAARLREPVMNIRPRLSELNAKGMVRDTGSRGRAMGGRKAIIWAARDG